MRTSHLVLFLSIVFSVLLVVPCVADPKLDETFADGLKLARRVAINKTAEFSAFGVKNPDLFVALHEAVESVAVRSISYGKYSLVAPLWAELGVVVVRKNTKDQLIECSVNLAIEQGSLVARWYVHEAPEVRDCKVIP